MSVERMYGIGESARLLDVSACGVRRRIKAGDIRAVNIGSRIVISESELERVQKFGVGQRRQPAERRGQ